MGMEQDEKELTLHPDRQGLRMVLGDLEAAIMEVIWQQPASAWCSVRDVYETLRLERAIAYTTVMNTMTRLAKKGVLESTRRDTAYLYRPRQTRDTFIEQIVGHVLERLLVQFSGPTRAALSAYAARRPDERDKVAHLRDEVARRRAVNPADHTGEETPS